MEDGKRARLDFRTSTFQPSGLPDIVVYYVYKKVYASENEFVSDDETVKKAFRHAMAKIKNELIHEALREFIDAGQRLDLRDLRGKIEFKTDSGYERLRKGA